MKNTALISKISILPNSIKNELLDYMEFLIKKHKSDKSRKHPKAGCMKGTFELTSDFNAPINDFKEYM
ncbi:MAG: DUF2281 domain-containing protein [Bacteroidota bacterium]